MRDPHDADRGRMRGVLIPLVVLALALPAAADPAERALLGERLYGTIGADESVVVAFDAVAATSF